MTEAAMMSTSQTLPAKPFRSQIIPIGFALFAMFFGAGNLIFPLAIGAQAGQNLLSAILGFLLFGVGAPFLGLFATSLFHGNYEAFFNRLGKIPAFLTITFLMLIIGPLSAMPRTEVVTYQTFQPFLPHVLNNITFSLLFCTLVFLTTYKESRFMNILGYLLSPIKLISFTSLIALGLMATSSPITTTMTPLETLKDSVIKGYSTMDLLAAFFFCSLAYRAIKRKLHHDASEKEMVKLTLQSSIVGGLCLGVIYIGFILIANWHSTHLQNIPTEQIIRVISELILGKFGAFFVAICITFACFATAMALAEVCGNYLFYQVFRKKVAKVTCIAGVCVVMFIMTQLGFAKIMALAVPVLVVLYPALIVLCIVNILHKTSGFHYVKIPVLLTIILSLFFNFLY